MRAHQSARLCHAEALPGASATDASSQKRRGCGSGSGAASPPASEAASLPSAAADACRLPGEGGASSTEAMPSAARSSARLGDSSSASAGSCGRTRPPGVVMLRGPPGLQAAHVWCLACAVSGAA